MKTKVLLKDVGNINFIFVNQNECHFIFIT